MMNHEGKANRRFQGAAQVRIQCPRSAFEKRRCLVRRQFYLSSNLRAPIRAKIRDKTFNGGLL
jgi:hypothetical protein